MKNIFRNIPKRVFAAVTAVVLVAGMTASTLAGFGPDRPTKVWTPTVEGFDHVTFNSFTNVGNGVGDERDFMRGVQVSRDSVWADPVAGVTQDAEVEAKIYIHNNADASLNEAPGNPGIAKNVKVRVALPTGTKQSQDATAYISADNAQPGEIFDTLTMTGANNGFFELDYVEGSAKLHNGGTTTALSDALVTDGVNIGNINGCFEFVQEITYRVKIKMPRYKVAKQVRLEGQTINDWKESIDLKKDQTSEWKIEFDNTGRTLLNDVVILDQVPVGLNVVPGSVRMIDGNFPNGFVFGPEAVQNNGRQINVLIGNVNPGINSIVTFKAKVDESKLECGKQTLVNTAYATPKGYGTIKDEANVVVDGKVCEGPSYRCDTLKAVALGGRKYRFDTTATGVNGATVKTYTYNFGDGSQQLVTDKNSVEHTYNRDGTFNASVKVTFKVDGQDKVAEGAGCTVPVTVTTTTPPTSIPDTGAGGMVGLFSIVTVAGALLHRVVTARRLS